MILKKGSLSLSLKNTSNRLTSLLLGEFLLRSRKSRIGNNLVISLNSTNNLSIRELFAIAESIIGKLRIILSNTIRKSLANDILLEEIILKTLTSLSLIRITRITAELICLSFLKVDIGVKRLLLHCQLGQIQRRKTSAISLKLRTINTLNRRKTLRTLNAKFRKRRKTSRTKTRNLIRRIIIFVLLFPKIDRILKS